MTKKVEEKVYIVSQVEGEGSPWDPEEVTILPTVFVGLESLKNYVDKELEGFRLVEEDGKAYIRFGRGEKVETLTKQVKVMLDEIFETDFEHTEIFKKLSHDHQEKKCAEYYHLQDELDALENNPHEFIYRVEEREIYQG